MTRGYKNIRGKTMDYLHDKRIQDCTRKKQWATSKTRGYKNVQGKINVVPPLTPPLFKKRSLYMHKLSPTDLQIISGVLLQTAAYYIDVPRRLFIPALQ